MNYEEAKQILAEAEDNLYFQIRGAFSTPYNDKADWARIEEAATQCAEIALAINKSGRFLEWSQVHDRIAAYEALMQCACRMRHARLVPLFARDRYPHSTSAPAPFLVLEVVSQDADEVRFRIAHQESRGFADFPASNGLVISSAEGPGWYSSGRPKYFYACGRDVSRDAYEPSCAPLDWIRICTAVAEFNEFKAREKAEKDAPVAQPEPEKKAHDTDSFYGRKCALVLQHCGHRSSGCCVCKDAWLQCEHGALWKPEPPEFTPETDRQTADGMDLSLRIERAETEVIRIGNEMRTSAAITANRITEFERIAREAHGLANKLAETLKTECNLRGGQIKDINQYVLPNHARGIEKLEVRASKAEEALKAECHLRKTQIELSENCTKHVLTELEKRVKVLENRVPPLPEIQNPFPCHPYPFWILGTYTVAGATSSETPQPDAQEGEGRA